MKALILVDIQNDFTTGGSLEVKEGEKIIPVVNQLQEAFDLVVATQDWHPKGHKSFASSHSGKKPFEKIKLNGFDQVLWPDHCIRGSKGAEFHPDLDLSRVAAIFRKGMDTEIDSYSGFFDNGHLRTTGLSGYLRECEIDKVYITGLAGDICVYFTAKDAIDEGFDTCVIADATRPISAEDFEVAGKHLQDLGGIMIESKDLLR